MFWIKIKTFDFENNKIQPVIWRVYDSNGYTSNGMTLRLFSIMTQVMVIQVKALYAIL